MGLLQKLARAGTSRKNVCRNLHRLLKRSGLQYPVPLTWVPVTVKLRKPKPHNETLDWPILKLSDWVRVLVEHNPEHILGGMRLEEVDGWTMQFTSFWESYRSINAAHPVFLEGLDLGKCVPYALHGDEGRGLRFKPYLVESFQPCIGVRGLQYTNESGPRGLQHEPYC